MAYCSSCNRADLGDHWQWCPRCGCTLSAVASEPAKKLPANEMKEALIGFALNAAQNLVQHHLQRKLPGATTFIDSLAGSMGFGAAVNAGAAASQATGPSHSSSDPEWYHAAASTAQPQLSATERALAQARSISEGRAAEMAGQRAMQHADALKNIAMSWMR